MLAPNTAQRVHGHGRIAVRHDGGRTRLDALYQEGSAKIRFPRRVGNSLEAVLINTAGGLTGGDRLTWELAVGTDAGLVATTQACEKVYRAADGQADVTCRIEVGPRARLAWLPQETILFDRSALQRRIDVDLAQGARALVAETCIFGRHAMGEEVAQAHFRDRWRVRSEGRLVHAEDFAIGPEVGATLTRRAVADGAIALSSVLYVGEDAEGARARVRELLGPGDGASAWRVGGTGKLLARLVDGDALALRKRLVAILGLLNEGAGMPKVWAL